jgi:hypothetical protein
MLQKSVVGGMGLTEAEDAGFGPIDNPAIEPGAPVPAIRHDAQCISAIRRCMAPQSFETRKTTDATAHHPAIGGEIRGLDKAGAGRRSACALGERAEAAGKGNPPMNGANRSVGDRSGKTAAGLLACRAAFLLGLAGALLLAAASRAAAQQPIQFNHKVHVNQMTCVFCHRLYETREMAGRPELFRCMLCHAYDVTKSAEAQRLRALAGKEREISWIRLTRVAPFVRFSHQRHVVVGKVDCAACHGDIAQTTQPPSAPLVPINMQLCLDCHRAKMLQLDPGAFRTLQTEQLPRNLLVALKTVERKRFRSSTELLGTLTRIAGAAPTDEDNRLIAGQLHPAKPVTTDCFACHR